MTDTSTRRRHSRSDKPRLRAPLGARSRLAILCAADTGCRGALLQRGLRQQLHAVKYLRIARGETEVRERGAQLRTVEHNAVAPARKLQLNDRAQHLLAARLSGRTQPSSACTGASG